MLARQDTLRFVNKYGKLDGGQFSLDDLSGSVRSRHRWKKINENTSETGQITFRICSFTFLSLFI